MGDDKKRKRILATGVVVLVATIGVVQRVEGDTLRFQQGGILRCRRDGRDLHVFSTGLRNIYDVALDDEAATNVDDDCVTPGPVAIEGSFQPDRSLVVFDGEDISAVARRESPWSRAKRRR